MIDGLVVGGGANIDPALYKQERLPNYGGYDEYRDRFELAVLERTRHAGKPVLAICRGMQLLNVAHGGTLNQNAWADVEGDTRDSVRARYEADILAQTQLSRVLQRPQIAVNRLHRQSVDRIGTGLRVSAVGQGDVVHAIESTEAAFLLGVQWHPEYLPHHARHQRLFHALVTAAR